MNQELEDLMLEYLLRKKLNMTKTSTPKAIQKPQSIRQRRPLGRHVWTDQDAQKVAFLYRQGLSLNQIAKQVGLRTSQVAGAVRAMQNVEIKSTLPRLLVQS